MLDPWIIEEIRRREEAEQEQQRPTVEIPMEMPHYPPTGVRPPEPQPEERGVIVIDI